MGVQVPPDAPNEIARVVELVDTPDLKSDDRKVMPVRFRPRAPKDNGFGSRKIANAR
jgi:hypothetical protein